MYHICVCYIMGKVRLAQGPRAAGTVRDSGLSSTEDDVMVEGAAERPGPIPLSVRVETLCIFPVKSCAVRRINIAWLRVE